MSLFFIRRPNFAWVVALFISLAGLLAIPFLPVAQYPNVAPPQITVTATYPGASAQVLTDSVTSVIEEELNGAKNLLYFESTSNANGIAEITVTFQPGTDPELAQVDVQNRLKKAEARMPQAVLTLGIQTEQATAGFLLIYALSYKDGGKNDNTTALADYAARNINNEIRRVPGVGKLQFFASEAAMRVWIDPQKLVGYGLSIDDVNNAIRAQNVQVPAGAFGSTPGSSEQQLTATLAVKGTLDNPDEFAAIVLRANQDGSRLTLGDVARIEVGSQDYNFGSRQDGKPAVAAAVQLSPGANAIQTAEAVKQRLDELSVNFPDNVEFSVPYDTSRFVDVAIDKVIMTLVEAMVLVFLVMFLFLQNVRYTLIPSIVVPVCLLGTLTFMYLLGFSVNMMTMFGMVLAIGILVDDAIVVVENVERVMREEGLSPKEATKKSMGQIQGALVGIGLVLSAVFLPMAFFGGSTGVIYRQFSITIVSAMALSVLVALIFTPALCATLLKPIDSDHHEAKRGFFGWFNRTFDRGSNAYQRGVAGMLKRKTPYLILYLVIVALMAWMFTRIPTAFLPEEDQGVLFAQVQTPSGSSAERTQVVVDEMRQYLLEEEASTVQSVFTVTGFNFAGRGQSSGMAFIMLKPWGERPGAENGVAALAQRAQMHFFSFRDALVFAFAPPAVMEMGNATGFNFFLQDQAGVGHQVMNEARDKFLQLANQHPVLDSVRANGLRDEAQYQLLIDDERARALGLSLADINSTLSIAWGASYVNDFIDRGRVKKVYLQGVADARMAPEDLNKWYVRNDQGRMVPFSAFASGEWTYGPPKLARYNGVSAVEILGAPAPGYSTGDAMAAVEEIASQLPQGVGYSWTGLSYEERLAGSQTTALFVISAIVVFLCLAALYESWSIPFSVMLVVPLGIIGALAFTELRGLSNDVFFKVGLLTTIGLSARNAILIVEFAKAQYEQGMTFAEAAIEACRMRLRPIIMTSLAFILGCLPLAIASGAGAGSKHAIGTGVIGGMLSAMVLAIFWIPLFYVVVCSIFEKKRPEPANEKEKEALQ